MDFNELNNNEGLTKALAPKTEPVLNTDFLTLKEMEKAHIFSALELSGGNKTQAAKLLGVSLKTIYNKLNEYNKVVEVVGQDQEAI
jgi:DNA-binding NtrC family response regulator